MSFKCHQIQRVFNPPCNQPTRTTVRSISILLPIAAVLRTSRGFCRDETPQEGISLGEVCASRLLSPSKSAITEGHLLSLGILVIPVVCQKILRRLIFRCLAVTSSLPILPVMGHFSPLPLSLRSNSNENIFPRGSRLYKRHQVCRSATDHRPLSLRPTDQNFRKVPTDTNTKDLQRPSMKVHYSYPPENMPRNLQPAQEKFVTVINLDSPEQRPNLQTPGSTVIILWTCPTSEQVLWEIIASPEGYRSALNSSFYCNPLSTA